MLPPRPTEIAHTILRDAIREGDLVVDATAGNGHDTVFLAQCVGETGQVMAYDIQAQAIASAQLAVAQQGFSDRVQWHQKSHSTMADDLTPESARAIVFNLGYLPGDNHQVTTETQETLKALAAATTVLQAGGCLSILCYPGHEEGAGEAQQVEAWITQLPRWRVAKYAMLSTKNPAPFLLIAHKPE